jgi:hypothetical protein
LLNKNNAQCGRKKECMKEVIMINKEKLQQTIIEKAGREYQRLKMDKNPYSHPEHFPDKIQSDQIRAIAFAIVNELVDLIESVK